MRRARRKKAPVQLGFSFRTHGGRRPGAGRRPKGDRAGVSHRKREAVSWRTPVHVTLRLRPDVWNLRTTRCFRLIRQAFAALAGQPACRLVHYSVQGNHLHLILEAKTAGDLARAIQSLSIRIARGLNRLTARRGPVFQDRYHAVVLRSPLQVRRALAYVLNNARRHAAESGYRVRNGAIDPFSSARAFDGWNAMYTVLPPAACATSPPSSWLLRLGWRKHGLIPVDEVPAASQQRRQRVASRPRKTVHPHCVSQPS